MVNIKEEITNLVRTHSLSETTATTLFFLERILARLAVSPYRDKFIIKGGFLLTSELGITTRFTKDLDMQAQKVAVTLENIRQIFLILCAMDNKDDVQFMYRGAKEIRKIEKYEGYRITLQGRYADLQQHFHLDIATGDVMTPDAVEH